MNKEELLKETYYINGVCYINSKIEEEIKKHIKNIEINVTKEIDNEIYVYGKYKFAECRLRIDRDYLFDSYNNYLEYISREIKELISNVFFSVGDSNE